MLLPPTSAPQGHRRAALCSSGMVSGAAVRRQRSSPGQGGKWAPGRGQAGTHPLCTSCGLPRAAFSMQPILRIPTSCVHAAASWTVSDPHEERLAQQDPLPSQPVSSLVVPGLSPWTLAKTGHTKRTQRRTPACSPCAMGSGHLEEARGPEISALNNLPKEVSGQQN